MGSTNIPAQPAAPDYAAANREGIYTDIETLPLRRQIEQAARLGQIVNYVDPRTGQNVTADFTGLGDAAGLRQLANLYGESNANLQRQQLALRRELGTANAEQTAREIQAADPLAYATRQQLTGEVLGALRDPAAPVAASQSIYDAATRLGGQDASTAALNFGLMQALQDYQRGGELDPETQRQLTNQVRAGQAARGNFLGDAAAVVEAATMGQAAEQRRAQRLGQLLDVQGRAFGQNQQLNQAALQGAAALSGEERAARNETFGRQQQALANASAMVLGQPITNQFGALQGAQNGSVAFTPLTNSGFSGVNQNAGASGAQWAQQNYTGAQNIWNTQAGIAQADTASRNSLIAGGLGSATGLAALAFI